MTISKLAILCIGTILLNGCGPSAEEKEQTSYSNGYSEGYQNGYKEALECVNREGGDAEDGAYYCER